MHKHPVLFVKEPKLMRGINYRSTLGITLILCKGFKTKRDIVQAKGRVGRYGDPCTRYRTVPDLEDRQLKLSYLRGLQKHLASL